MKYEQIQELLDHYWEGETTLEEERRIKAYFHSGAIDERLRSVAPMFQALREEQAVQLAAKAKALQIRPKMYQWAVAASAALLLGVAWWMFREGKPAAPMAVQTPTEQPKAVEEKVGEVPQNTLAASETPSLKTTPPKKKSPRKRAKPTQEIDPETAQAMADIKAALALVSSKIGKGRDQAIKGATHLDAVDKVPKRKDG
ncbi:MAG: hypothetical protein ACKVUS_06895 [Saprospiraceae bacterium]